MSIQRRENRTPSRTRSLDNFFKDWPSWQPVKEESLNWKTNADLFDDGETLVLLAEIPGIRKEDINISVSGDILTISGERKTGKVTNGRCYRSEIFYGKFARSITLPEYVDPETIQATYFNGMLEINMAKLRQGETKPIEIKSN